MSVICPHEYSREKPKTKLQAYIEKLAPIIHVEEKKLQRIVNGMGHFLNADWAPTDIFYSTSWESNSYTIHRAHMVHNAFLGTGSTEIYKPGDQKSYSYQEKHYTPLGQWFNSMPGIVSIVKVPYYIVAYLVNIILFYVSAICGLLFTSQSSRGW